jgi:hypothetical protein
MAYKPECPVVDLDCRLTDEEITIATSDPSKFEVDTTSDGSPVAVKATDHGHMLGRELLGRIAVRANDYQYVSPLDAEIEHIFVVLARAGFAKRAEVGWILTEQGQLAAARHPRLRAMLDAGAAG